jgi:membrane fusion protein, multidrug efflux system
MRALTQLAIVGVLGFGAYGVSQNWTSIQPYVPEAALKALGPLLPKSVQTAGQPGGAPQAGGRPGGAAPPPVVEVLPVTTGVITEIAEAVGTTRAFESVQINAKISGIVEAISFNEGSTVKAGDELLRLDGAERRADLEGAKASITQEEAKRNELRTRLDRAIQLRRSGAGTEALVDDLQAQVKTSDSAIQNVIARERGAQARMNDVVVRAPFAGRVGIRQVSVGTYLETRTNITTLDDITRIRLDFQVPESLLARIELNSAVKASAAAFENRKFDGRVVVIDTRIDPVTRSVRLSAIIDNTDLALRPGMFMNAFLEVTKREKALLIPEEAVVGEGPLQIAFAVKDNKVERRIVKLGQRESGKVEVTEGLALGEQVVVRGLHRVRGGLTVNARLLGAAPPPGNTPPGGPTSSGAQLRSPQAGASPAGAAGGVNAAQAAPVPGQPPVQRQ